MIAAGKWLLSDNEEHWTSYEEFDTKEDALASVDGFVDSYGIEPGCRVWIGQVDEMTADELAEASVDAERVIESIDEWIYDQVGDLDNHDTQLQVTPEQTQDLEKRLKETIKQWLVEHKIGPACFRMGHVESVVVEEKEDEAPPGPVDSP